MRAPMRRGRAKRNVCPGRNREERLDRGRETVV
jgi:hypothetical protein